MLAALPMQVRRMSHGSQQDQFLLGSYSTSPWSNSGSAMLALKPKPQHNKLSIGLLKASNTTGGRSPHACGIPPLSACRNLSVQLSAARIPSVCALFSFQSPVCLPTASFQNPVCLCICHLQKYTELRAAQRKSDSPASGPVPIGCYSASLCITSYRTCFLQGSLGPLTV